MLWVTYPQYSIQQLFNWMLLPEYQDNYRHCGGLETCKILGLWEPSGHPGNHGTVSGLKDIMLRLGRQYWLSGMPWQNKRCRTGASCSHQSAYPHPFTAKLTSREVCTDTHSYLLPSFWEEHPNLLTVKLKMGTFLHLTCHLCSIWYSWQLPSGNSPRVQWSVYCLSLLPHCPAIY